VFDQVLIETSIRLLDIDAPELHARCDDEKARAVSARNALAELLPRGAVIHLRDVHRDKFGGRYDAHAVDNAGRDISQVMLAAGAARPYDGGKRGSWCE
jgi:endonuclease YncB( thermonuclease family)